MLGPLYKSNRDRLLPFVVGEWFADYLNYEIELAKAGAILTDF